MLNFYRLTSKTIEIDMDGAKVAYMSKTFAGWLIEVTDNANWDNSTTFYWIEPTAKAAFKECYRYLRKPNANLYRRKWYS